MCVLYSTSIPVGLFVCLPQIVALTKQCTLAPTIPTVESSNDVYCSHGNYCVGFSIAA